MRSGSIIFIIIHRIELGEVSVVSLVIIVVDIARVVINHPIFGFSMSMVLVALFRPRIKGLLS